MSRAFKFVTASAAAETSKKPFEIQEKRGQDVDRRVVRLNVSYTRGIVPKVSYEKGLIGGCANLLCSGHLKVPLGTTCKCVLWVKLSSTFGKAHTALPDSDVTKPGPFI